MSSLVENKDLARLTFTSLTLAILGTLMDGFALSGIWKRLKEIKTDDKNDTYFLLAAEEKAIDYSRIQLTQPSKGTPRKSQN